MLLINIFALVAKGNIKGCQLTNTQKLTSSYYTTSLDHLKGIRQREKKKTYLLFFSKEKKGNMTVKRKQWTDHSGSVHEDVSVQKIVPSGLATET